MKPSYFLQRLSQDLKHQAEQALGVENVVIETANPKIGADLAIPTFALAGHVKQAPDVIAKDLSQRLKVDWVGKIEPAGGYVNVWVDVARAAPKIIEESGVERFGYNSSLAGQMVLVEHTDPNPFKQLHIGHVYSNTIGEAIARLHEATGAEVHRVSYHGDVGPHIARAIYGIRQLLGENQSMQDVPDQERSAFLGRAYALGARAHKEDESAKQEIDDLNRQVYGQADAIREIYETGKNWSFEYFDSVYRRLGVTFEKQYLESQTAVRGLQLVRQHTGDVYEESDGAIIFRGEDYGLHTRVFITQNGLPLYETKDLGLVFAKQEEYPETAKSIIITAREQADYFSVMLKSLEQFAPELAAKTRHIAHGEVRLPSGKMGSRTGDVVTADDLFNSVTEALARRAPDSPAIEANMLAAIKYAFLKQNIGANIVLDIEQSISLEGQTGPYVQYAAVRIQSILNNVAETEARFEDYDWQAERGLMLKVANYPLVVAKATEDMAPHLIAQYSYELARDFNRYYEGTSLKHTEDQGLRGARRQLLQSVLNTLKQALNLLNISLPEKM